MMIPPFVIAYYTDSDYEKESVKLRRSLEELCIPHAIKGVSGIKGWDAAVRYKPRYILECLSKFQRNILYVDVDAIFRKTPSWELLEGIDVGVHLFQRDKRHAVEYLTGTVYIRHDVETMKFVTEWARLTDNFVGCDTPEQEAMKLAVTAAGDSIRFGCLPYTWCFIFDDMKKIYPDARPVIEHFQASRRFRFKEGKGS